MAKTYVSQFTLHFGPATCIGQLVPVKMPEQKQFRMVTPEGGPVTQMYRDDQGAIYLPSELKRGVEQEDGSIRVFDAEQVQAVRSSPLPLNIMSVSVHRSDEVTEHLYPSPHNAYIMQPVVKNQKNKPVPDPINDKWYDFMAAVVREATDLVFLGIAKIAKSNNPEALYQLGAYQGYVTIQRMLYPEALNQFEVIHPELKPTEMKKALAIAHKMVQPFDLNDFRDTNVARLNHLISEGEPYSDGEPVQPTIEFDLDSTLEAYL